MTARGLINDNNVKIYRNREINSPPQKLICQILLNAFNASLTQCLTMHNLKTTIFSGDVQNSLYNNGPYHNGLSINESIGLSFIRSEYFQNSK